MAGLPGQVDQNNQWAMKGLLLMDVLGLEVARQSDVPDLFAPPRKPDILRAVRRCHTNVNRACESTLCGRIFRQAPITRI
jgi:hypothetical protein